MEKYNIDEQLHRKLSGRTIAPSATAWERIAHNRKLQQQQKRKLLIYKIAAIIVISLGLLGLFINNNPDTTIPQENKMVQGAPVKNSAPVFKEHQATIATENKEAVVTRSPMQQAPLAYKHTATADSISKQDIEVALEQSELQKANQVAQSIADLADKKGVVSQSEVDALLLNAQKELAMERLKSNSVPTSDTALLKEAETQVEETFREKTLDIFKHKFRTIKIALSDK
jgi:hypothetical protein